MDVHLMYILNQVGRIGSSLRFLTLSIELAVLMLRRALGMEVNSRDGTLMSFTVTETIVSQQ